MSLFPHLDCVIPMHFFHVNCKIVISDLATMQITSTFYQKPWVNQECDNQGGKRGGVGGAGGSSGGVPNLQRLSFTIETSAHLIPLIHSQY